MPKITVENFLVFTTIGQKKVVFFGLFLKDFGVFLWFIKKKRISTNFHFFWDYFAVVGVVINNQKGLAIGTQFEKISRMKKQVLFIQGGGDDGYAADGKLVRSLENALGKGYEVRYPRLKTDEESPDFGWLQQIGKEVERYADGLILVAHSLGASLLLKYLSENKVPQKLTGVFLAATPYWSGKEQWQQGLKLLEDFADSLPKNTPLFFYHCRDDEEVPFEQFGIYRQKLPQAKFREIESGGHQLGNNLSAVAEDIKEL